ncbi:hypothetical protein ACQ4LE_004014 [Meloidogyne hapla]
MPFMNGLNNLKEVREYAKRSKKENAKRLAELRWQKSKELEPSSSTNNECEVIEPQQNVQVIKKFLPPETKLDIFKCLNFNILNKIAKSSRHLYEFMKTYKNNLPKEAYEVVELIVFKCNVETIEMEDLNVDFILCEEMEFKWKEALNNKIPTYLNNDSKFLDDEQTSKERFNQQYNFATNESANLFLVPKPTDSTGHKILSLKIKRYPKTTKELFIIRYWLKRLSHCIIENIRIDQAVFNPEIIDILFDGSPTFKLHTTNIHLLGYCHSPKKYEFMYHHVVVHGSKGIHLGYYSRKIKGEMIKEEERYYSHGYFYILGTEFGKVVEYEFFEIDNPKFSVTLHLLFSISSKIVKDVNFNSNMLY